MSWAREHAHYEQVYRHQVTPTIGAGRAAMGLMV
jgi:hypothetical protein